MTHTRKAEYCQTIDQRGRFFGLMGLTMIAVFALAGLALRKR